VKERRKRRQAGSTARHGGASRRHLKSLRRDVWPAFLPNGILQIRCKFSTCCTVVRNLVSQIRRNLVIPIPYYSIAGGGKAAPTHQTIRHQGNPGVHTGSETSQELHKQQQQGVLKPHIPDIRLGANEYSSSRRECAALQISPLETSLPQQQEHNKCGEE
jgi:hypothetical protein